MRRPVTVVAALACGVCAGVAIVGGCAFDWGFPSEDSPDGAGDAPSDKPNAPDVKDGGGIADTSPPATTCTSAKDCAEGSYCDFADHQCGKGLPSGRCEVAATKCDAEPAWVCGCNASLAKSLCENQGPPKSQDVSDVAPCTVPPSTFRCGTRFCNDKTTFCVTNKKSGIAEYECVSFEPTCLPGTCACTAVTDRGCSSCDDTTVNQVKVTCP